jgi:hypothetical protein
MATKLTRLTHNIAIQLHLVAENCTICSSRSRRPVRKLLDTTSYCNYVTLQPGSECYIKYVHMPQGGTRVVGCLSLLYVSLLNYMHLFTTANLTSNAILGDMRDGPPAQNDKPKAIASVVKLSLYLTKHQAMKTYEGMKVQLHELTSALDGGKWPHDPAALPSGKEPRVSTE